MNALTNLGEQVATMGNDTVTPTDGSIARSAKHVKLYTSASVPSKAGTGFVEVANGNGYTTGGQAIAVSDFTFSVVGSNGQIKLADKVWTASGGNIADIAGAYMTDVSGNVLAWWARATPVTLTPGDSLTLDDLTIRLT
jgi:hypothetical protein